MTTSGKRRARRSAKKNEVTSSATPVTPRQRAILFGVMGLLVAAMVAAVVFANPDSDPNRVWSVEHQHWHDANGQEIK